MIRPEIAELLIHIIVFYLGAGIGSFLNVVIYRLPLNISVNNPRRSFCFSCKKQIPWYRNLPLFTWLLQRGKCAECGASISVRYFFVELLTGLLFYAVFRHFLGDWGGLAYWGPHVLIFWIFTALLVAGTFIDIDHYLLPHSITIGGLVVRLVASFAVPGIMDETSHGRGILISFVSACLGLGILWSIAELGKLAFGKLKKKYPDPKPWSISQPDENEPPVLTADDEVISYGDIFSRPSDRLVISVPSVTVNDRTFGTGTVEVRFENMTVKPAQGEPVLYALEDVKKIEGRATEIVVPREAMGYGDALLMAMVGSFLGWKAVLFTIVAASVIGSILPIIPRLIGKTAWTAKIPFGPYLAAGAMIWLFYGPQFVEWYLVQTGWRKWEY